MGLDGNQFGEGWHWLGMTREGDKRGNWDGREYSDPRKGTRTKKKLDFLGMGQAKATGGEPRGKRPGSCSNKRGREDTGQLKRRVM